MPQKKEIQIVAAKTAATSEAAGGHQIYRDTTVPLAVQPKNIRDTSEVSTPYSKRKQVLATFCATLGCFLNGTVIGYSAPAIPSVMDKHGTDLYGNPFTLTSQQASWITGILSLGCFFGCIIAGPIMEKLGRRKTLLYITSSCFFLGYLSIFLANSAALIYLGRFLGGMGLGFELAVATVYIVEIAATDMRGILGCFVQFMGSLGVLFTFVIGSFLSWYWLALVNGLTVILFIIGMLIAPESPRWLILKGKEYSASKSLEWLRGRENAQAEAAVDREIEKIKRDIAAKRKERVSLVQLRTSWKPFAVSLGMMFLLQFSALNVLVYYAVSIFQLSEVSIDPNVASIIVGLTLLVSCMVALVVVSRLSRKLMLVTSILFMGICHIVLAICFHVRDNEMSRPSTGDTLLTSQISLPPTPAEVLATTTSSPMMTPASTFRSDDYYDHRPAVLGWLPVLTVVIFLFMGNIGYGTLIWVVTAELLPPKVRSVANSIIICFAFLCGFFIAKTFVDLLESLGKSGTFFLYGGICIVGTLLTAIFVPETRGKSIEEIQRFYTKNTRHDANPATDQEVENTPLRTLRT